MSRHKHNRSNVATKEKPSEKLVDAIFGNTEAEKVETSEEAKLEAEPTTEPTSEELEAIENQENGSQTVVSQLDLELAEASRMVVERKAELTKAGASGVEADELMAISASILEAQSDVVSLQGKLESQRADSVRSELLEGIGKLCESVKDRITITKLAYEAQEVEIEGVKSIKPILRINEAISTIGKRKASSTTNTTSKLWHSGTEKLTSRELCDKIEAQAPDVVAMVSGTAKVAPDRAIKAIKKRGLVSLAWLNSWQSEDGS